MTAIIRYKTLYVMNDKDPFVLSFVLGTDVSLSCVLGLPTLLLRSVIIDSVSSALLCI